MGRGQPSLYTHNRLLDRFSDMALYTFQLNGFEKLCKKFCDGDFVFFAQILGQKVPTHILPTTTRIGLIA